MKKLLIFVLLLIGLPVFSLEEYTTGYFQNMSAIDGLNTLMTQEKELQQSKEFQKDFVTFYKNLYTMEDGELGFTSLNSFDMEEWTELKFKGLNKQRTNLATHKMKMVYPKSNLFKLRFAGEGQFDIAINHKYLYNKYHKKLPKEWQEFLRYKTELRKTHNVTLFGDGYLTFFPQELKNTIINYSAFMRKYPEFPLNNFLKKERCWFIHELMVNKSWTWDDYMIETAYHAKLSKDAYQAITEYLKEEVPDYPEYEYVKIWFGLLQQANFDYNKVDFPKLHQLTDKLNLY